MPRFIVVHAPTIAELEIRVNVEIQTKQFEPLGGIAYSTYAQCYVQGGLIPDKPVIDTSTFDGPSAIFRAKEKGGKK